MIRKMQQTLNDSMAQHSKDISHLATVATKAERLDQSGMEEVVRKNRREIDECRKTVDSIYS